MHIIRFDKEKFFRYLKCNCINYITTKSDNYNNVYIDYKNKYDQCVLHVKYEEFEGTGNNDGFCVITQFLKISDTLINIYENCINDVAHGHIDTVFYNYGTRLNEETETNVSSFINAMGLYTLSTK